MSKSKFFTSSNPFVSKNQFGKSTGASSGVMTVQGAVNKTLILTAILVVSALGSWSVIGPMIDSGASVMPLFYGGIVLAMILAFATYAKPTIAPITAPIYAIVEGGVIGLISGIYASAFGAGVIFNALMLTVLCLAAMLVAYKTGLIRATEKFRSIVVTATMAIGLVYVVNIVMGMFGMNIPYLHEGGLIGIGISLVILAIASLNLILDFDNIEQNANQGAPKVMEWASALGLLMTLVWIYIELLRLVSMFSGDD